MRGGSLGRLSAEIPAASARKASLTALIPIYQKK